MPMIGPDDALPLRPERVLVAGTSGSGKSTLARQIAQALDLRYVEIDALFHGPDWTPRESFFADVEAFSDEPRWVTEWQYPPVRPLLAERAQLLVWLDLRRTVVMRQVVTRTLRRRRTREVLWNGNVEGPLRMLFTDPEHIIRWAWSTHSGWAERIVAATRTNPQLVVVRLRSHAESRRWFANLRS